MKPAVPTLASVATPARSTLLSSQKLRRCLVIPIEPILRSDRSAIRPSEATGMSAPEVTTTAGAVRGAGDGDIPSFKGIPYAAPPTGVRRFLPPHPVRPWTGVRDTLDYGASCP